MPGLDARSIDVCILTCLRILSSYSEALSKRAKGAGFFKTLLLRRIGSTLYSGQRTVDKLLSEWAGAAGDEQEFSAFLEDEDDMDELSVVVGQT